MSGVAIVFDFCSRLVESIRHAGEVARDHRDSLRVGLEAVRQVAAVRQVQACAGVCRGGSGAAGCVGLPVVERLLLLLEAA